MARKKFFTMVEMLIVMAILSVVAGAVGFNMLNMRRQQQFVSGTALVEQKLQAALETMLIHHNNVRVIFDREGGKLKLTAESETPLERGMGRLLETNPVIEGIGEAVWRPYDQDAASGKAILVFSAMANAIPKGTLTLYGTDSSQKKTVVLKGYPHPIKVTDDGFYEDSEAPKSEEHYPREVRARWPADGKGL